MALPEQYLMTTKNLESFLNSLINAQAPQKVSYQFLQQLDFTSSNDRLLVGILKTINFIDANGVPTERYYRFIDQTQSKFVLAEAIKQSYADLFAINKKANEMTVAEVKNKMKTIFQGSKTDNVLGLMANTFHALCECADFTEGQSPRELMEIHIDESQQSEPHPPINGGPNQQNGAVTKTISTEMHYNIQIHLPETRDNTVYDAIFRSLKEHLL